MTTTDTIRRIVERSKNLTVPDQIEPLNRTSFMLGQYQELMRQVEEAINRPGPAAHCDCSDDSCPVWAEGYEAAQETVQDWYEPSERGER